MNPYLLRHSRRRLLRLVVILLLAIGSTVSLSVAPPAYAASIMVNTTDDELNSDGDCSLREALQAANEDRAVDACAAGSGADTITLPAGTYKGGLVIRKDLSVIGAGTDKTILAQGWVWVVLNTSAAISNIEIQGGFADDNLGFANGGSLIFTNTIIRETGGIKNYGSLVVRSSLLVDGGDAGIYNADNGSLVLENSKITGHSGDEWGGGVANQGHATITNSLITGNSPAVGGGGIMNWGVLTVANSTISHNGTTNEWGAGGGIFNSGELTVVNTTIDGNTAASGSGIFNVGTADLNHATITNNSANINPSGSGSALQNASGIVRVRNTLIAGNVDQNGRAPDCGGILTSQGYNLIQNPAGCTITGDATGNLYGVDPRLGPLQDNGGPTPTHALLPGSPAIDAGNPAAPGSTENACAPTDQRGVSRPQDGTGDGSARCDIGAYEVQGAAAAPGKVTGGGTLVGHGGGKATFGLVVQRKAANGPLSGNLEYQDQHANLRLKSATFHSLTIAGDTATFSGTATVNGQPGVHFTITARDGGEGRRSRDTFSIRLQSGYANQGPLTGGNLQVHNR